MWPALYFDTFLHCGTKRRGFCLNFILSSPISLSLKKMCFVNAQDYLYLGISLQVYILALNKDTVPHTPTQ